MENNLQLGVEEKPCEGVQLAGFGILFSFFGLFCLWDFLSFFLVCFDLLIFFPT